ncbi:unnamed protein product [Adineta steineri]|uniref:Uncharacterized protein n=1 Tax=Adineta steineri TaxID=433720 RepID=A0A814IEF4_9BILA|nr:unnamed protein product [Adineta steineri]
MHVAPHNGYSIKKTREFVIKYGPYLRTTLKIAQVLFKLGSFVIPHLDSVLETVGSDADTNLPTPDKQNEMEQQLNLVEKLLDRVNHKWAQSKSTMLGYNKLCGVPLQVADLREVETYLDVDNNKRAIHDRLFTVVALLPDQVSNANLNFNPINVESDTTFDYIYLLYKTDRIYVTLTIERSRYQEPAPSHSPSNNTLKNIIWIISKSLDRNVKYYEERARRSDENGNYTLAALYKQLQLERNQLRIAAMQQLSDLI